MADEAQDKLYNFMIMVDKLVKEGALDDDLISAPCEGEEWTRKRWMHSSDILKAFVCGVIDSQSWELSGVEMPSDFEYVCNRIKNSIKRTFMTDVVKLSFAEVYSYLLKWTPCRETKRWPLQGADEPGTSGMYMDNIMANSMLSLRETVLRLEADIAETEAAQGKDATTPAQNNEVEGTLDGHTKGVLR